MEKKTKVESYNVEYVCDECGIGNYEPTGECNLTTPPQYPHVCTHCNHRQVFRKTYPFIAYEEIN